MLKRICILVGILLLPVFSGGLSGIAQAQGGQAAPRVVIDPAHGGGDPGVRITDSLNEKDLVLTLALLLQKEWGEGAPARVALTRTTDRDLPVSDRIRLAESQGATLFISLHINAGFSKTATGYELYFPGFQPGVPEKGGSEAIIQDMTKNRSLNDSVRLAQWLQKHLDQVFPRKSRGLREAPVPVLDGLTRPAVVIELGFSTHPEDRKRLLDDKTHKAIATALAKGIKAFF